MEIDLKKFKEIGKINENTDKKSIYAFAKEAREFLLNHKWCNKIIRGFLGFSVDGVLGVFLFEIEPVSKEIDNKLWVITGDLPPAYLVIDRIPNSYCALAAYIEEMELWIEAVRSGESLEEIIPVNVPPEVKYADMLETRLNFIKDNILSEHQDELKDSDFM